MKSDEIKDGALYRVVALHPDDAFHGAGVSPIGCVVRSVSKLNGTWSDNDASQGIYDIVRGNVDCAPGEEIAFHAAYLHRYE